MSKTRDRLFLAALVLLLLLGIVAFNAREVAGLRSAVQTQCQFNRDIGNLAAVKVVVNPQTHKASKVGIAIVADSRAAFRGLGCDGRLSAPVPSFSHWAKIYGLPAN